MREPPPGLQPGCGPATCVSSRIRYAGHPTSAPCCFRERQAQNVRRAKTTASGLDSIRERPATHSRAKHFSFPPQASQKKSDSSEATDAQRETSRSRRRALALVVRGSGAEEQRHANILKRLYRWALVRRFDRVAETHPRSRELDSSLRERDI